MNGSVPRGWYIYKEDQYACMCGWFKTDDLSMIDTHICGEITGGYCNDGIRCLSDSNYECVCGKQFSSRAGIRSHSAPKTCIKFKLLDARSFCKTCELQLESIAALKRHTETKRHIEASGPIIRDLECKVCNIICRGQKEMKSHLDTKKHKQTLEHGKIDLNCSACGITCQGQKQMLAHLETKKHKKLLANETAQMGKHITGTA